MGFKGHEQQFGLQELYRPTNGSDISIYIIAVHGLGGHATKTWSANDQTCWLSDPSMLSKYMPNARVLAYGYNANISSWGQKKTSKDRILQHAVTLVQSVQSERSLESAEEVPIIWLCHSLGGIVVKRALAYSSTCTSQNTSHLQSIYTTTMAILFFGTPHHGSSKAKSLSYLQKISSLTVPSVILQTSSSLTKALESESEILQNINDQFSPLMRRFCIFFFWETEKMDLKYTKDYVVEESSAAPILDGTERCGLVGDHRSMCKFAKATEQGFRTVVAAIKRYEQSATNVIKQRQAAASKALMEMRMLEANELVGDHADGRRKQVENRLPEAKKADGYA
jgi:hypothetical protein